MKIKEQTKYYLDLLKDEEILFLKSDDSFFKCHYKGSPLNVLTGFSGTAGEAVLEKNGKITLFVDSRYHILADKQVYSNVEVFKMPLNTSFSENFKKKYKKNTIAYIPSDIGLNKYLELSKYFDLRKYDVIKKYLKNEDLNKKEPIFEVSGKIEKNSFEFKINKIKKTHSNIDRMLIFNLDEISYLTNLRSYRMKYSSNFKAILYLNLKSDNYILFVEDIPKKENLKINNLTFMKLSDFHNFILSIEDEIYINKNDITLENYLYIKNPKEIKKDNLALISSIKPISVIQHLIESSNKLDLAILAFKKRLKAGLSEVDLVNMFEQELIDKGAKCPSFKTLLALGENSASIHYSSYDKNKILKDEMLLLLDCGGYYEGGYATDITRTFYFGKNPKPIYKKIYTNVLKAFLACFLSKETNAKKLDNIAREILNPFEAEGFFFNHGLGHGIGTSVHQNPPILSMLSDDIIKPYQTHSIEPGLYGKDKDGVEFGVRIENCVYNDINYNKISLSKFPFEEILIDWKLLDDEQKEIVQNWQEIFKESYKNELS